MLQPLPLQLAKEFLGDDGESKQPGLNVAILAGNVIIKARFYNYLYCNLTVSLKFEPEVWVNFCLKPKCNLKCF